MKIEELPVLETERLILRRFSEADGEDIYQNYASDPMVTRYVTWNPHESSGDSALYAKCAHDGMFGPYQWAIVYRETGRVIGAVGLCDTDEAAKTGEFGYVIGRAWWNREIVTEAMRRMLDYLYREQGFRLIIGQHDVRNAASGRVMEKCGFRFAREGDFFRPMKQDTVRVRIYEQTAEEYEK